MFGFLNINKPSGITSHKVISILRKITGIKQIGHAGTLDPLASGVLPTAIGKAAKLIDYLPSDKSYIAGLYLGMKSDTYDITGSVIKTGYGKILKEDVIKCVNHFKGRMKQIPPAYSAVHYKGKRLYELARENKIPDKIPARDIDIYKNEIIDFDYENQILRLDISCSKGTYIRTIINDIGEELQCGAVMFELKRTKSSAMEIENSVNLDEINTKEDVIKKLIPAQELITISAVEIKEKDYQKTIHGMKIRNNYNARNEILLLNNKEAAALAFADEEFIHPKKVLI